jgi:hypothetical protein
MTVFTIIGSAALLLLLLYRAVYQISSAVQFLSVPKAHYTVPFTSWWVNSKRRQKRELTALYEAHQQHGKIIQISPKEISVASTEALRKIYIGSYGEVNKAHVKKSHRSFDKDPWYLEEFMNYNRPNLVSMLDFDTHSRRKRMITGVYSQSYLSQSIALQEIKTSIVHERLEPMLRVAVQAHQCFDAFELSQAVGSDFMTAYLFGLSCSTNFVGNIASRRLYLSNFSMKRNNYQDEHASAYLLDHCRDLCEQAQKSASTSIEGSR